MVMSRKKYGRSRSLTARDEEGICPAMVRIRLFHRGLIRSGRLIAGF